MKPLLLILLSFISFASLAQSKKIVSAIREQAYPLTTTDPQESLADLEFLKNLLIDRPVIGLGEATHGTKEFFTMKHRMVRYLVEEMGYRVFIIEANEPECRAINDYIMDGYGDPAELLHGIYFWTWNAEEVLDMIKWMKAYNETRIEGDKIKFYGCDMQYAAAAAQNIAEDLQELDINYSNCKSVLDTLSKTSFKIYMQDSATLAGIKKEIETIRDHSVKYKEALIRSKGAGHYMVHQQDISIMLQSLQNGMGGNGSYRDSCMAANIKWISEFEKTSKLIVWAHNTHISKTTAYNGAQGYQTGYWLSQLFDNYYAVGFDFYQGSFRAKQDMFSQTSKDRKSPSTAGVASYTIKRSLKGSTGAVYHKAGLPVFYLDFRSTANDPVLKDFLHTPIKTNIVGAIFSHKWEKSYYHFITPVKYYDAVIFIDATSPSLPTKHYVDYINANSP